MGSGTSAPRTPGGPSLPPDLPTLKIALVGDPGVGKTSILLRYLRNQFSPLYVSTKKVAIENVVRKLNVPANTVVSLTFWDIPGREDMDLHKSYFRNLDAAIVVVDLTDKATVDMANVWKQTVLNKLTKLVPSEDKSKKGEPLEEVPVSPVNFPVLLLGNKFDVIEDQIYQDLANRQVSVSMDVNGEVELRHDAVVHLEAVAEEHNFIGSVAVSAKQSDSSVAMAIQHLVRNILKKHNIPRKWKAVPDKPKPPKKDRPFIYDKLEKTDLEKVFKMYQYNGLELTENDQQDVIIEKADALVKQTVVFRHYHTVSLARFKHACKKGGIIAEEETSIEQCILGMKNTARKGTIVQIIHDEGFVKFDVSFENDEEVKQTKPWKQAYRIFHNEYVAVSKAILKDGPNICLALEKYDNALEAMLKEYTAEPETIYEMIDRNTDQIAIANKIVRNKAKVQHSRDEMQRALDEIESAGKKIYSVEQW